LVRPLSQLRAVILQASANPDEVAVFLYESGSLTGPASFSTVGMRIQNEQSGSTSLFAQPMALEPVPEEPSAEAAVEAPIKIPRGLLESRLDDALAALAASEAPCPTLRQGHLALLKRWYYRPEVRRSGEIFFPNDEGGWPVKAILRGVGRVYSSKFKAAAGESQNGNAPKPESSLGH
jgi:hypothetical protein